MSGKVRLSILVLALAIGSLSAIGQDLGSSNKLFGGSTAKTKAPANTGKKPSIKRTSAPARPRTAAKRPAPKKAASTAKTEKPVTKTGADKSTTTAKTAAKSKTDVKTERSTVTAPPTNAAANELFEKLIDDGNAARDDRNYSSAEAAYKRAKGLKPKDSRAIFGLGNLYSDQQRWDEAETAYREALKLNPDDAVTDIALSYVLSQPIATDNLGDRYEEAERLARRATELEPRNALAFDQLGVAMELRGLISPETESAYRTAIRLAPAFAPPYAHLGRLLRRRGRLPESSQMYETAVRNATDVPMMILVADVMQSEQRYAESEPLLRAAVGNDPRNPTGLLLLGRALTTTGNYPDAEMFLKRSIDVSPNAFMSNSLLASLYIRQGKFELAEVSLMQAQHYVAAYEKRGLAQQFESVGDGYIKMGKAVAAERAFRQARSLDPENQSLSTKLASAQRH